ncbi:MAG: hypothetical protein IJT65_06580 [Eubacterium sp.]|nr:hypothetical protein [Eubacterium sp.]
MKKELDYFNIGYSYGGNQEWFNTFFMKIGGCAAETAIELCIYLDKYRNTKLCPFDADNITKKDYIRFGDIMKPYLHPRFQGIDTLSIYTEGFGKYLRDVKGSVKFDTVEGTEDYSKAEKMIIKSIDNALPVAFLMLNNKNRKYKDYFWHWFIINGYNKTDNDLLVKAVNYSTFEWLSLSELWNSGYERRGGIVSISL